MEDSYSWPEIRDDAINRFRGELPHAQTEDEIIEVFELRPKVVIRAIDEVAESVAQGKARSGWAVLRSRLHGALDPGRDVTVSGNDRDVTLRKAEQWIRNAGFHVDREAEIVDSLFGEDGSARDYRHDDALRSHLLAVWHEVRPLGERVDSESVERLRRQMSALRRAGKRLQKQRAFAGFVEPANAPDWTSS